MKSFIAVKLLNVKKEWWSSGEVASTWGLAIGCKNENAWNPPRHNPWNHWLFDYLELFLLKFKEAIWTGCGAENNLNIGRHILAEWIK